MQEQTTEYSAPDKPYGFWVSTGVVALITLFSLIALILVLYLLKLSGVAVSNAEQIFLLGLVTSVFSVGVIWLVCLSKHGIRDYCKLILPSKKQLLIALGLMLAFGVFSEGLRIALGLPLITDFERDLFLGASSWQLALVLISVVVFAPFWEELIFRGFLLPGWSNSIGKIPAVILSSGIWAGLHWKQYEFFYIVMIFAFGLLVGALRLRMKNLLLCMLLHFVNNLACSLYAMYKLDMI